MLSTTQPSLLKVFYVVPVSGVSGIHLEAEPQKSAADYTVVSLVHKGENYEYSLPRPIFLDVVLFWGAFLYFTWLLLLYGI